MLKIMSKEDNFDELVNDELVLVDFYADWCGPCKMLIPHLEKLGEEYNIVKVNVDDFREIAMKYAIMSIPALYVFKKGKIVDKKIGYQELAELEEWMESIK